MADKVGLSSKGRIALVALEWFGVKLGEKVKIFLRNYKVEYSKTSEAHVFLPVHEPDVDQADQKSLGSVGTLTFDPSVSFHGPREIMFLTSIIQELKE